MIRLLNSELIKLRTTRTAWVLLLVALALELTLLVLRLAVLEDSDLGTGTDQRQLLAATTLSLIFLLSLSIVNGAGEHRHHTISASYLIAPDRWRVLTAKAIAHALLGLAFGVIAAILVGAIGIAWLSARGIDLTLDGSDVVTVVVGWTIASALAGVLGIGIGALVRNQPAALVGALVVLLIIEPTIGALVEGSATWLPFGAALALAGGDLADALPAWAGGLVFLGYGLLFLAGAIALAINRDVS